MRGMAEVDDGHILIGGRSPLPYTQWIRAKLITTASDNDPPEMLRTVIDADPALKPDTQQLYAPAVAPPLTFKIKMSFAEMNELFNVNVTLVTLAKAALFIVI
jgi:hypothetical protein